MSVASSNADRREVFVPSTERVEEWKLRMRSGKELRRSGGSFSSSARKASNKSRPCSVDAEEVSSDKEVFDLTPRDVLLLIVRGSVAGAKCEAWAMDRADGLGGRLSHLLLALNLSIGAVFGARYPSRRFDIEVAALG
jgi:hypothetical protein